MVLVLYLSISILMLISETKSDFLLHYMKLYVCADFTLKPVMAL